MIQGRVLADDSRAGQFTGEAGISQPQCADDVRIYIAPMLLLYLCTS